jgi:glycosyltransferase involved in cell wall biosynthesis
LTVRVDMAPEPEQVSWSRKGRILMVIKLLAGRGGGAERLFCEMASFLAEAGYEVTALYCDPKRLRIQYPLSPKVGVLNLHGEHARHGLFYRALDGLSTGYQRGRLRAPVHWLAENLYFTRRLAAVARSTRPDLIISFLPPANTPSLLAGVASGTPVIPTNHNVPERDYASTTRWDQNPLDKALRLQTLRAATKVHVIFPEFADWFPDDIRRKVVAIPNYVAPAFLEVPWPEQRAKVILAAGRLAPVKNYRMLVEAWALLAAKHPDWSVQLYGAGPERPELGARIRRLALEDSFHLMEHAEDMKTVYAGAEIFCHPAVHEGFGLAVAEALAGGLPVVAFSDCEGVIEFVRDGDNGVLAERAGGARALAAALERLITDSELRTRLRARTRESVRPYSFTAFRDRWLRLVADTIAEARRP